MMIVILFTFSVFIISFFYCCCCCFAKVKSLHFYILLFCYLILLFYFTFCYDSCCSLFFFSVVQMGRQQLCCRFLLLIAVLFYFMCIITCASSNGLEHLLSAFSFYFCTRLRFALLCFAFLLSALAFGLSFDAALVALYWRVCLECVCVLPPPLPLPSGRSRRDRPQKAGWAKINRNKKNNLTNTTPGLRTHASSTCWEIRFF